MNLPPSPAAFGNRRRRAVAVIATSATPDAQRLLRTCTTVLEEQSGLTVHVVTAQTATAAAAALAAVPDGVDVLFFPHATREFATRVQTLTGTSAVTAQDTTIIALTAALSTTLARAGRTPRSSHVVIAGAATLPFLAPVVMLTGVGQITKWYTTDAAAFPLYRITAVSDAVIDLVGAADSAVANTRILPALIAPDRERDTVLALPGLIRAIALTPRTVVDVEVHRACALALVMATPLTETRPPWPDHALTDAVASVAAAALLTTADHPFTTNAE